MHMINAFLILILTITTSYVKGTSETGLSDHDVLDKLEALEKEQVLLREGIRKQMEKNKELLKLLEDDVDIQKRLFLVRSTPQNSKKESYYHLIRSRASEQDGLDNGTMVKHPTLPSCPETPKVGFHTRLVPTSLSVSSGNVIFDLVETNVGDGYNSSTGYFVAPYAGNYEFILTLMSRTNYAYDAKLMRDNTTELCRAHAATQSQAMGACVTMVELPVGAMVSVRPYSGSYVYGGKYTSFSGHLIN